VEIKQFMNSKWIKKELNLEILKFLETNKNGGPTHQNLCNTEKAVLKGKFTVINTYIKNVDLGLGLKLSGRALA
jgi:hypothetical protein